MHNSCLSRTKTNFRFVETGFSAVSVIGGRDIVDDRRKINRCKAIVGTPGRLLHLIQNNMVCLKQIELLVLDEADKLFSGDFRKDIKILFNVLDKNRQVIASSATYADDLDKLLLEYMQNPIAVSTTREVPMLIGVKQFLFKLEELPMKNGNEATTPAIQVMLHKVKAIEFILSNLTFKQCILFSNSQLRAESFSNYLTKKEWTVDLILGSQVQQMRTSTLQKFRQYESRILISSDLMARGIDIENVNLVINLDVPGDSSTYLHRIGRCGRFGTHGIAVTFINDQNDMDKFTKLMEHISGNKSKIDTFPISSPTLDSDIWDFSKHSQEIKICATVLDEKSDCGDIANGSEQHKIAEVKQMNDVEKKNRQLLEITELLISNNSGKQIDLDVDLFSSYSNDRDNVIDATNGNSGTSVSDLEIGLTKSSYDKLNEGFEISTNLFDDFKDFAKNTTNVHTFDDFKAAEDNGYENGNEESIKIAEEMEIEQDNSPKENLSQEDGADVDNNVCFINALKSMNISDKLGATKDQVNINIQSELNLETINKPPTNQLNTEKSELKTKQQTKKSKSKPKISNSYASSGYGSADSNTFWNHLYWQQINQINHYVSNAYYRL